MFQISFLSNCYSLIAFFLPYLSRSGIFGLSPVPVRQSRTRMYDPGRPLADAYLCLISPSGGSPLGRVSCFNVSYFIRLPDSPTARVKFVKSYVGTAVFVFHVPKISMFQNLGFQPTAPSASAYSLFNLSLIF